MSDIPGGYAGTILRVNLTDKRITEEELPLDMVKEFIGGRGFNVHLLYREVKPGIDPLGPENKVFIGVGPCAGTSVPGNQRFNITSKSPLSGFLGDSNSGGDFGAALKYAGYDVVILEGRSEKPVYLFVNDEKVEIRDAAHIWGKTTFETRRIIERELGDPDVCIASIGQGGEHMVRFANLISELGRASGRSGIGAVLGSKKIKAIAASGGRGVRVADPEMLKTLNEENNNLWMADQGAYQGWTKYGPTRAWGAYAVTGMLPTRNFQSGTFDKDMFEDLVKSKYLVRQKACISCPLGCNHSYVVRNGPYAGTYGEGIELDHLGDFCPKIGNEDLALGLRAATMCDKFGVDMMDMTALISWVMECHENGILTPDDLDGINAAWGNPDAILNLIERTAYRKGIGDVLAEGLPSAARTIGKNSERFAMHSKGLSLVMRNVRVSKGWALMYATSSRGACHMRAWLPEGYGAGGTVTPGIWDPGALKEVSKYNDPLNALTEEGKAELVKWYEDLRALRDTLDICHFALYRPSVDAKEESSSVLYAHYINAVTGLGITGEEALRVGERICNVERAFNLREGLTRSDDSLPSRMLNEPMPDGPSKGHRVDLQPMIDRYYEVRGWNKESGFPTKGLLLDLNLPEIAEDLEKMGKIA